MVYAQGASWSNRLLVLYKRANDLEYSRFGFSVSRRTGNAVVRNRVKRALRQATRPYLDLLCGGWDIVIIARRGMARADFWLAERALTELFASSGVLREGEPAHPDGAR